MSYEQPGNRQPHAVTRTSDGWQLQYDANGNLLAKLADAQSPAAQTLAATRFQFDAENRLVQVDVPTTETVSVTLAPGWNFFSLPVIPNDLSIAAVFPSFGTDFDQISRYNPAADRFEHYVGAARFDDFTTLEYGRGYEVYCANPAGVTLTLTGAVPTAAPAYALSASFHLIGSSALESQTPGWLLLGVDYDSLHRYDTQSRSLTTASQIQPAQGYFVHVASPGSWRPPLPRDVATRMTYDATGARLKRSTASESVTIVNEAYEVGPGGVTKQLFAGGLRIGSKGPAGLEFVHGDHLGSTNVLTDATGTQQARLTYSPFGELASATGADGVVHRFTGQRFDQSTGLYFYQARYYDPSIGRFLSADPIVQDPADPQFLNRFAYVRNNPLRFVDPSGLSSEDPGCD
ncbi:MAG: RHS repeat-associated core domain-containing protein, partial [Candidatus Omnitrophota bacterium]|nr:RHS repeat-associated core domain-containing protein [Candidatus Omnitrophota bacterium]